MNRAVTIICVTLIFGLAGPASGQQKSSAPDSKKESYYKFKNRLPSEPDAAGLLEEAELLKVTQPGEALNKVEEALGISVAQGDSFNEGKAYMLIGEINDGIQEWNLALANYLKAHEKFRGEFLATPEYRKVLQGLGNANLRLGLYQEALRYLQEAVALDADREYRAERWLDISEVYYQMGDYAEAQKALDNISLSRRKAASSLDVRVQNQRAKVNTRTGDVVQTQDLYRNSLNTLRSNNKVDKAEEQSLQETKEEISGVLREQQQYDMEIDLRNRSIEYNLESNNLAEVTKDRVEIGKTLAAKGENDEALKQLEKAAQIAGTLDNPKEKANAYLVLAGQYEKNGRTGQALNAYRRYSQAVMESEELTETRAREKSTLITRQEEIEQLTQYVSGGKQEASLEEATVFRQQLIIYGLLVIIAIIGVTSYFIYKNARASKAANQLLALKSLRGQMNPHFIFNALNSVNQFIAQQDERTANRFLTEFSQLMRLVLDNSQEDFISLSKEQELLSLYLKLEHYRFRDKFDYEIKTDPSVSIDSIEVPPMLIQPYIENAVWHGLRYRETKGKLALTFSRESDNLVVEIIDDGIGRKKSAELKTENQRKHNSTGLKNIRERLAIINKVYKKDFRVSVSDFAEGVGTRVLLYLPIGKTV
jgi:tetratricopeptide (TPR) repeat protein